MNKIFLSGILILITLFLQAQELKSQFEQNGEVYFKVEIESVKDLPYLSKIISIDNREGNIVYAYANEKEFKKFLEMNFTYKLLSHPNEGVNPTMATFEQIKNTDAWDSYPTYDAYVAMMYQFETDYPAICDVFSIGQSVNGRELLVAKISDNIGLDENEPEFFYTSTMHGDETAGYVFMLRLIDSLLTSYGTATRITNLVNNIEIYINPLANPDGTYNGGNSTVSGATRYNANGYDLNRNFPDVVTGLHPYTQTETYAFMAFEESRHFIISCNIHSGAEVCNYPWDHKYALAADDDWWQFVCHEYADTAQTYSPWTYMDGFDDGITNGAAWYPINGGRQDYMNYFHQCREFTLEISNQKLLTASLLPAYWGYNYRSLLNYIEQSLYGIRGLVTDTTTGLPLEAEIFILNHDTDSSWVYSSLPVGNYHRLIDGGTYDLQVSAPGYLTKIIENVLVTNYTVNALNIQLMPDNHFELDISVFLEGPYSTGGMNVELLTSGLLPLFQPYNVSPWNYNGAESVTSIPNPDVVDWILIELRDAPDAVSATSGTLIQQQAAFLLKNGLVVGLDGISYLQFANNITEQLFVVIMHRNHLAVMSANPLTNGGNVYSYDFSAPAGQAYGADAQVLLENGEYGLYGGDLDGNGIINDFDKLNKWDPMSGTPGYLSSDVNFDGQSDNPDKNEFWINNKDLQSQVPN
ncbi:MAG: hypothetical protein K8S16_12310 [Bacteroidales bacterium]|nr:hypothetical protein [Bacteroidales bacterium]